MQKRIKVLYAEDNPMDRDLMQTFFTDYLPEYELSVVGDGEAVFRALKKEKLDILLLDYQLPDIDGLEIARQLRAAKWEIPILLLTVFGDENLILQSVKIGINEYLPKREDYVQRLPSLLEKMTNCSTTEIEPSTRTINRPWHILYVEDEMHDADLLMHYFTEYARHLLITLKKNFTDALEALLHGNNFDLVLCDLQLPDGTAIGLMKQVQTAGVTTPFILVTGKGNEKMVLEAFENGAYDYVIKKENYFVQLPHILENAIQRHANKIEETRMIAKLEALTHSLDNQVQERTRALKEKLDELSKTETILKERTIELDAIIKRKDTFFSLVAHDIKSPFNVVLGFLDLIITEFGQLDDPKKLEYLERIDRSVKKIYSLLENILEWATTQSKQIVFEPKNFRLHTLCNKVYEIYNLTARQKNIRLSCQVDEQIELFADENMIYTILRNLVSNAIKFSYPGGSVRMNACIKDNQVEITVTDHGIGIEPEQSKKLFQVDQLITTPGTAGEPGTGFGLLLTHDLIELNKGKISFISDPGKETVFTVVLPVAGKTNSP